MCSGMFGHERRVGAPVVSRFSSPSGFEPATFEAEMATSYILKRSTPAGATRYLVRYRTGGRRARVRYGGSFRTLREAKARRDWITGELAAMRVPDLGRIARAEAPAAVTLREAAEAWRSSRVDVARGTDATYSVALQRLLPRLGRLEVSELDVARVAAFVGELHSEGLARESIRKTLNVLAMILDHAGVAPNPARDRVTVRLPRRDVEEIAPPTAAAVEAVVRLLPSRYRLPVLALDATGMRVGELEALRWVDLDEPRGRWRVSAASSKTRRARWIVPPPELYAAVVERIPREDRDDEAPMLDFTADRLRTAIARACRAAGVPLFSPHDLRHRRISLWHLAGVPWARIGEAVGQRSLAVTADTYTHVLIDEAELDLAGLL